MALNQPAGRRFWRAHPRIRALPERAIVFKLKAWDRNCPLHIPQLIPVTDAAAALSVLEQRVADLQAENARLKAALQSA